MTLVEKFTAKYGINPLKLVEDANLEMFGLIKSFGLQKILEEYIDKKNLKIDLTDEFFKELVECFAEAGEKFPENVKAFIQSKTEFEIPNKMVGSPKSKGTLENFKDIVGKDELRPVMSGVFVSEDGKELVGTDAHKLVVLKTNYYRGYAGKIIDLTKYIKSKGKIVDFIDGKYPNYNAIILKELPYEERGLVTYSFYNYVKSVIEVKRLVETEIFSINMKLMTESSGETKTFSFGYHILFDAFNFAMLNGWSDFRMRYSEPSRAMVLDFGDDNIILVMPIFSNQDFLSGTIALTPEEIQENYRLYLTNKKPSKPTKAPKPARPSAPVSSEPFKKFEGNIGDTSYISRRQIDSITLTNGEVLGANDVIDGFYRVNKKMAHGGSMYAGGGNLGKMGSKTYKLRAEGLNDFLAFLQNDMYFKIKYFTIEPIGVPDVVVTFETSSSLSEIKEKLKEVPDSHVMLQTVKPINEYTGEREEEGKYAHGGSMSSSHEVGDTVTFNSVMGGMKTGEILSTLGADGYRIKTADGFAMVKKSAIV